MGLAQPPLREQPQDAAGEQKDGDADRNDEGKHGRVLMKTWRAGGAQYSSPQRAPPDALGFADAFGRRAFEGSDCPFRGALATPTCSLRTSRHRRRVA